MTSRKREITDTLMIINLTLLSDKAPSWFLGTFPIPAPWLTMTIWFCNFVPEGSNTRGRHSGKGTGPEMHCSCFLKTMTLFLIRVVLLLPKGFPCNQGSITMTWGLRKELSSLIFISWIGTSIKMAQACFTVSICGIEGRTAKTHPFLQSLNHPNELIHR